MGQETINNYVDRLEKEGPALTAPSFGDIVESSRLMTFVSSQEGADNEITNAIKAEMEKYKKITGNEKLNFGFNPQGFPTHEEAHKQYKELSEEIEELKKTGADIKSYEEILSQSQEQNKEKIINASRLSEKRAETSPISTFVAEMLGGMVGYAQTPTGAVVSALPVPLLGKGTKILSKAGAKNLATVAGIEGVINAGIAVEQTKVQGEALGDPATNAELAEAGLLGFGFGAAFGGALGAGTQAIRNRFNKVQGFKTDREARDAYQAQADRVVQAKAEKGAVEPSVEEVGEVSREMAFLYDSKPSNIDIEDHVMNLVAAEEQALRKTYDDIDIDERIANQPSEELLTYSKEQVAEIEDARRLVQNEPSFQDLETGEVSDLLNEFRVLDRQAKEFDLISTCMVGGKNES